MPVPIESLKDMQLHIPGIWYQKQPTSYHRLTTSVLGDKIVEAARAHAPEEVGHSTTVTTAYIRGLPHNPNSSVHNPYGS